MGGAGRGRERKCVEQGMRESADLVRDCSWHPYMPNLTTVSW